MEGKSFVLDKEAGYFRNQGVDIMAFDDIYPEGHQSGVSVIMHGQRVATNGDIRFEPTPGQWQPVPKQLERTLSPEGNAIVTRLMFPDAERHAKGFNPMLYPDYTFSYAVAVRSLGVSVEVTATLDEPLPEAMRGLLFFNMELFPGALMGRPWLMDEKQGIFPCQPNGPVRRSKTPEAIAGLYPYDEESRPMVERLTDSRAYNPMTAASQIAEPYAEGQVFTVCPDDPLRRFTVESAGAPLKLYDGRMNHNNGWFVLSAEVPAGVREAVRWIITPNVVDDWLSAPVVQTSQVGYHTAQPKAAVIELDRNDKARLKPALYKLGRSGEELVFTGEAAEWGKFLRYNYLKFDFSAVTEEGLYRVRYGESASPFFRIANDVYDRGVWQPVLEYFLPVQMCHMRVMEKYRVWHGLCHNDDARMAPLNYNHIDGYAQGKDPLCVFKTGDTVPGLNAGGWHDAGDFDLRIESQAGECYILALAYEEFDVNYDATTIDQAKKICEIHQSDGKNDIQQQIEHGMLSVLGGYRAFGRPYRGIICNSLRQYVLLGDGSTMTDGIPGNDDDRWVFTQDLPWRDFVTAAEMAASARALRGFNDAMSEEALEAARAIYDRTDDAGERAESAKLQAAVELLLATGEDKYRQYIVGKTDRIVSHIEEVGWIVSRAIDAVGDAAFTAAIRGALTRLKAHYDALSAETPYGIPYRPHIWGAGWDIQRRGFQYYFLLKAFPDVFDADFVYNSLNFILGCHPGSNGASFASGVGAQSATVAYGANRADWSFIPGGVVSGTALIRPDFPELLEFPFLWQQTEYVLGGGSSHYMFLVLAAQKLAKG